jgi:hypothetical protein
MENNVLFDLRKRISCFFFVGEELSYAGVLGFEVISAFVASKSSFYADEMNT